MQITIMHSSIRLTTCMCYKGSMVPHGQVYADTHRDPAIVSQYTHTVPYPLSLSSTTLYASPLYLTAGAKDDPALALDKRGCNLQDDCLHSVGTAPPLWSKELHADGTPGQHVAIGHVGLDHTYKGRSVGEGIL